MADGLVEALTKFRKVASDDADALVEFFTESGDLFGLTSDGFLLPAEGDGFEQGDQCGGGGKDHLVVDAQFDQRRVLLQRGAEDRFVGNKEHDKLGSVVELRPVGFGGEAFDMVADVAGVRLHAGGLHVGIFGFERIEVGGERHFGIDHDLPSVGQVDEHVGALALTVFSIDGGLLKEIDAVDHTRHLDGAAELHLAPLAADLRGAEGLHEAAGGLAELDLRLGELLELLFEARLALGATLFDFFDALVEGFQGEADGLDGFIDRFLAFLEVALGALLVFFEGGFGKIQEGLVVFGERFGGKRLEALLELAAGLFQEGKFFLGALQFGLVLGFEASKGFFRLGVGTVENEVDERCADEGSNDDTDKNFHWRQFERT